MVSKCDKPLEPLSTCPTYSNSFYPLQLFLPFHMYPNLPIHKNILHPYFVNNQLTFPPSQCPLVSAKCDKPLEPLSICPAYSNSFYPLQLFYLSISTKTLPLHKYPSSIFLLSNQLHFPLQHAL